MPVGYSGTPLPTKLGIKEGFSVGVLYPPDHLEELLVPRPSNVTIRRLTSGRDFPVAMLFARSKQLLAKQLLAASERIDVDGALWICWPKKTSPLFKDLTEDGVREIALPTGLVDVKVCAVDVDWSGLKLVFRKELREKIHKKRSTARKK